MPCPDRAATFRGGDVAQILGAVGVTRGLPERITVDNGTEFTSKALDHWAYWNKVQLDFSRPGKPVDNTFIEAFNGTLRRECLTSHWFLGLDDLQRTLGAASRAKWKIGRPAPLIRQKPKTLKSHSVSQSVTVPVFLRAVFFE